MGPTGTDIRVLQIHVSRRCNLQCLHCYSSSGPAERDKVPAGLFRQAITDAAAEGYNAVGISGGEPLMYRPLRELLLHARACGMVTTVTTNGMLLDSRRIESLKSAACLVAISLDGTPESHNRMRGSAQAFPQMARRLPQLRASGIPFGFIFTLTQRPVADSSARTGRSRRTSLGHRESGRYVAQLCGIGGGAGTGDCWRSTAGATGCCGARCNEGKPRTRLRGRRMALSEFPLSELLSPLIIEADGTVVPIEYSFGRHYALGRLQDARLPELAARWRRTAQSAFRHLCRSVYKEATAPEQPAVVNWYGLVSRRAQASLNTGIRVGT
jgi:hypothetical protein